MYTYMEFYGLSSALEDVVYAYKTRASIYQNHLDEAIAMADQKEIEKFMRLLNRCEKKIEETRALIFKTEALKRWTEAEKILFPERFN